MKVFEFHFNPTAKKNTFFKTFSSKHLYMVAELSNALPQNSHFLSALSQTTNKAYETSHHSLKETLATVNAFLAKEMQKGNVDWVGNLHAAVLDISRKGSSQILSLSKLGNMKVFVARHSNLIDMAKNVRDFKQFVAGALLVDDKIVCCTNDLFEAFSAKNFFHDIAFFETEAQFRNLFKTKEKELSRVSGILFSIVPEGVERASGGSLMQFPSFRFPALHISMPALPTLKLPVVQFPPLLNNKALRHFIPLLLLMVLLFAGFFLFKGERGANERAIGLAVQKAKTFESNKQFLEAWQTLLPFTTKKPLSREVLALQKNLEEKLFSLYSLERIENPKVFYEISRSSTSLIPRDMALQGNWLYLSNPFSQIVFALNLATKKGTEISEPKNIKAAASFGGSMLFFGEPNLLFSVAENMQGATTGIQFPAKLQIPFASMGSFGNNLYLFSSNQGEIVKVEDPLGSAVPAQWLTGEATKKAAGAKSMAVDGQIWLLLSGNEIQRYAIGAYQESFKPVVFPLLSQATQIKTNSNFQYLYVLDPGQNRILIFTKTGKLVKQYQSDAFNDLANFAVSSDEKTIFVLAGSKIFEINR